MFDCFCFSYWENLKDPSFNFNFMVLKGMFLYMVFCDCLVGFEWIGDSFLVGLEWRFK